MMLLLMVLLQEYYLLKVGKKKERSRRFSDDIHLNGNLLGSLSYNMFLGDCFFSLFLIVCPLYNNDWILFETSDDNDEYHVGKICFEIKSQWLTINKNLVDYILTNIFWLFRRFFLSLSLSPTTFHLSSVRLTLPMIIYDIQRTHIKMLLFNTQVEWYFSKAIERWAHISTFRRIEFDKTI